MVDGTLAPGIKIRMMATGAEFEVDDVGIFTPSQTPLPELTAGQVGYMAASIKNVKDTRVGDTITLAKGGAKEPLPGYKQIMPMVYCGLYPIDTVQYEDLRTALEKLQLNDASLVFEPETSDALGFGFRCGFLGLLHMEVVQERLEREYGLDLITTAPNTVYQVTLNDGSVRKVDNPSDLPPAGSIAELAEPYVKASIIVPSEFIGNMMELCKDKRGNFVNMDYLDSNRVVLIYELPLSEILYDFYDQLKSRSKGYASLDYEIIGYRPSDLERLDILINGEVLDALSTIVHKDRAYSKGKALVQKLRRIIPRQMFDVPVQAAIGNKVIARETVKALRKDVLAKCYGGDISRKRKLLEKQKEGKKRMKQVGSVEIPQEAFMAVLAMEDE